jgi:hypothetical protein
MKTQILTAIGETGVQPAARLNAALAANDRLKYVFSLLQMALTYAEHPDQPAATLKRERIACGIDDPALDTVVAGARMVGKSCRVPGAGRMAEIGLPVPPAFVLPTSWCRSTRAPDEQVLKQTLSEGIARLESATGLGFGATRHRHGSPSMQDRRYSPE